MKTQVLTHGQRSSCGQSREYSGARVLALSLVVAACLGGCRQDRGGDAKKGGQANSRGGDRRATGSEGRNVDTKSLRELAVSRPDQLLRELLLVKKPPNDLFDKELLALAYERGEIGKVFAALRELKVPFDPRTGQIILALGSMLGEKGDASPEVLDQLSELGVRGPEGTSCLYGYFQQIWKTSPGKADEALAKMKLPKAGKDLFSDVIAREVAKTDPSEGLRRLEKVPSDLGGSSSILILKDWLASDPTAALKAFKEMPLERTAGWLKNDVFIDSLIEANPVSLAEIYRKLPFTDETSATIQKGIRKLTGKNNQLAYDIASALPAGEKRNELLVDAFSHMVANTDPETLEQVKEIGSEENDLTLRGLAKGIGQHDIEKALDFVRSLPEGGSADVNREVARMAASNSPEVAVRLLEDQEFVDRIGNAAKESMVGDTAVTWAKQDRAAAQKWVQGLSPSVAPRGVQGLMTVWMKADASSAGEWLSAQPPGPARDAGIWVVLGQIKDTDPAVAEQWRASLSAQTGQ